MRDFFRRLQGNWLVSLLLLYGVLLGVYWFAEWIFGPYRHWTLWVRVPLVTAIAAVWLWTVVVAPRWRRRRTS